MLTVALIMALGQAPSGAPSLSQGRSFVKALVRGDGALVWKSASPTLLKRFPSAAAVAKFAQSLQAFGTESRVVTEGLGVRDGLTVYRRVMAVSNYARGVQVEVTMEDDGRVAGLAVDLASGAAPTTSGAYKTVTRLRPPVAGTWQVLWGGRTWEDNKHASVSDMRYALDLWVVQSGNSFAGPGTRNEDYFAWGQPALAAGAGTVVTAVDGVPDNLPNRPAPGNLYGNHVIIDHGNGEYSLLAHLEAGSLRVKVGEAVSSGQPVGRVGNSGMSTEPHLHFHLMDNADWRRAHGLPAQLQYFTRNGQLVQRGEPRRGDSIAATSVEASR
jgi:murein DD-endopeptidase MepM/ murein hydrolase activator NlpD